MTYTKEQRQEDMDQEAIEDVISAAEYKYEKQRQEAIEDEISAAEYKYEDKLRLGIY